MDTPHLISTHLRARWNVLNLGATGAGPLQELAILREYGSSRAPRVVVWIYYEGNDLWDLGRESSREWLLDYLEPAHTQSLLSDRDLVSARYRVWLDSLIAEEPPATPPPTVLATLATVPRFRHLRALIGLGVWFPSEAPPLGLVPRVLTQARADVEGWGGRLLLAYMPAYSRYAVLIGESHKGRTELLDFAASAGITLIDLDPVFREMGDPRSMWTDPAGHLSERGYQVAADAIASVIRAGAYLR